MPRSDQVSAAEAQVLQDAIEKAIAAHRSSGRTGIAAAIMRGDTLVGLAENAVFQDCDPTRHAEIVVMGKAAAQLGTTDLSGCTLISTLQPCEMCLAAMRFAGITRVIFAAQQANVGSKYFMFPKLTITDFQAAGEGFTHIGGVSEQDVLYLYADGEE
ncbi:nucleoside deaminase [Pseudosulfitobacter koreensis]|uniref:Nucleoside deaminase n=1 Tax=Pseudosulfitobacter koreensis TaxID=2968472 RepID=A0ABT1Z2L6_9RHOB|nr:nucleoside deaminase [Pseudosulfitobacter koreense]MCR8827374.1 nucleoside deaminase [Pseudosulfitobacter koreense]